MSIYICPSSCNNHKKMIKFSAKGIYLRNNQIMKKFFLNLLSKIKKIIDTAINKIKSWKIFTKTFWEQFKDPKKRLILIIVSVSVLVLIAVGITIGVIAKDKKEIENETEISLTEEITDTVTSTEETTVEETTTEETTTEETNAEETTTASSYETSGDIEVSHSITGGYQSPSISGGSNATDASEANGVTHTRCDAWSTDNNDGKGTEDNGSSYTSYPLKVEGKSGDVTGNNSGVNKSDIVYGQYFPTQGVYVGNDGFLFTDDSISDYNGEAKFSETVRNSIIKMMKERNDWVESVGKKMYFVIAPNKATFYDDYMPSYLTHASYTRFDDVVSMMQEAGVNMIDLRDSLSDAISYDPERLLYYKEDTHWNNHGGFTAYQAIMNEISKDYPEAVTRNLNDYQINYYETFMKDQAYALGFYDDDSFTDYGPQYTLKGTSATYTDIEAKDKWGEFKYTFDWPNGYSDHLYYYKTENTSISSAPKMYLYCDSYGISLELFFKDSFSETTHNWSWNFSKSDVLNSDADVIIMVAVERNIQNFFARGAFS